MSAPRRFDPLGTALSFALGMSGWVALAATRLPAASPLRLAVTAGFFLACPGWAAIRLIGIDDLLERAVYSVALSAALAAIVSTALVLVNLGSATVTMLILAVLTTAIEMGRTLRTAAGRPARS